MTSVREGWERKEEILVIICLVVWQVQQLSMHRFKKTTPMWLVRTKTSTITSPILLDLVLIQKGPAYLTATLSPPWC